MKEKKLKTTDLITKSRTEKRSVCYLFRKQDPGFHSIETVFSAVIPEVAKQVETTVRYLPHASGMTGVLKNLLFFRKRKGCLYHITGQDYYMVLRTGRHTVMTIHDTGSALTGSRLKRLVVGFFWFRLPARIAGRITVISGFSLRELAALMPFAARKTVVVYNPADPRLVFSPKPFNARRPVILLVGTKPNKNLERIIPALKGIVCDVVVIGKPTSLQETLFMQCGFAARRSGRRGQDEAPRPADGEGNSWESFQGLPYEGVVELYGRCDLVCFASTYEGFGLPVLEAQATGRAVVTSRTASMPEVAGEGACLVDPFSIPSIREGVIRVIGDAAYRERLIQKGSENLERFSVAKTVAGYLEVYKTLAAEQ